MDVTSPRPVTDRAWVVVQPRTVGEAVRAIFPVAKERSSAGAQPTFECPDSILNECRIVADRDRMTPPARR